MGYISEDEEKTGKELSNRLWPQLNALVNNLQAHFYVMLRKLEIQGEIRKLNPHIIHKNQFRMNQISNIGPGTSNLLEDNIKKARWHSLTIMFSNRFLKFIL